MSVDYFFFSKERTRRLFDLNLVDMNAGTRICELGVVAENVIVIDFAADWTFSQHFLLRACKRLQCPPKLCILCRKSQKPESRSE